MALSIQEYRAWLAERHLQMFALKAGVPTPAQIEAGDHRKAMVAEAFALADAFVEACKAQGCSPWGRESL